MPLVGYRDQLPRLGERAFLAPSAWVSGDVSAGDDVSFWFHTVARGDVNSIVIGSRSNVQDGSVLHVNHDDHPLVIGEEVVVGHAAVVHGCTLGNGVLVGIGARVLDGAVVEDGAQIAAGAVVAPGQRVGARELVMGVPAKAKRVLSDEELERNRGNVARYVRLKDEYRATLGDGLEVVDGEARG